MADKDYKIENVQERKPWTGTYGTFNSFALQLEGIDGWVELSQKQDTPAPSVGSIIFGHIETTTRNESTYMKFKKAKNPNFGGGGGSGMSKEDSDYVIMMLEELTGRRDAPDSPTARSTATKVSDIILEDIEDVAPGSKINLDDIPF
jgi:hypothetical protein